MSTIAIVRHVHLYALCHVIRNDACRTKGRPFWDTAGAREDRSSLNSWILAVESTLSSPSLRFEDTAFQRLQNIGRLPLGCKTRLVVSCDAPTIVVAQFLATTCTRLHNSSYAIEVRSSRRQPARETRLQEVGSRGGI